MRILPQNYLKCVQKNVVDLFVRFHEKKKNNFESFSVSQNLVIFRKKTKKKENFHHFFFDPTPFSAGNRQTAKKKITPAIPND